MSFSRSMGRSRNQGVRHYKGNEITRAWNVPPRIFQCREQASLISGLSVKRKAREGQAALRRLLLPEALLSSPGSPCPSHVCGSRRWRQAHVGHREPDAKIRVLILKVGPSAGLTLSLGFRPSAQPFNTTEAHSTWGPRAEREGHWLGPRRAQSF